MAARTQAVALCEQVEQANGAPAMERLAAHAQIREWRAALDGIGELPRADARGLRDRFEGALSRFETALADQDRRDLEAAGSNLLEAGRQIRAYERAVMQDAPPDDCAALKSAAEAFMAGVHRWPKGGLQALKQALARADSASGADEAARERTLRTLCIRSEIASSTPTPPGDQELRREYQMRLLMVRMGQASAMVDQDWDAMLLEWIGIGAVAPEIYEELQQRFMRCLANRPAKISREPRYQDYPGELWMNRAVQGIYEPGSTFKVVTAIGMQTIRAGDIIGEHTVIFGGLGERLEVTHRAHSRDNFARGAVRAARWVVGQKPGFNDMQNVLGIK